MQFKFEVQSGDLIQKDISRLKKAVKEQFGNTWGFLRVTVYPVPEAPLSEKIRRYYWMLCGRIAQFMVDSGRLISKAQVHELNKEIYFTDEFLDLISMQKYKHSKSHTDLSNKQMLEICDQIKTDWAEKGLVLPDIAQERGNDGLDYQ